MAHADGKKKNTRRGVLICGSYGHGNAGDEAILEAMLAAFREYDRTLPLTVMSRSPAQTERIHGVHAIYKFSPLPVLREMLRARLYVNGGGSLIQDATSSRSLYYYLFTIMLARLLGCRVIMYGCGIGPVSRPRNRRFARWVIDNFADIITLREDDSLNELKQFGVSRPQIAVSCDPALTLAPAPAAEVDEAMRSLGLDEHGAYLCIVPRKWPGFGDKAACFAECADRMYEEFGLRTVFLSIDHKNDSLAAEMIAGHMKSPCVIARDVFPPHLTIGLMSRMRAVVSMRLHGLIFAAGQGIPLVGVSYDPKVAAFLRYVGQGSSVGLDELTGARLTELTRGALALWDDRDELQRRVARLRALESVNLRSAAELMKQ